MSLKLVPGLPVKTVAQGSLMTTDRWRKLRHHNVTGRECRGDARGLAGLPQAAADVPEAYLRGRGFPLRSVGPKPQTGLPSLQHQSQKEPR